MKSIPLIKIKKISRGKFYAVYYGSQCLGVGKSEDTAITNAANTATDILMSLGLIAVIPPEDAVCYKAPIVSDSSAG